MPLLTLITVQTNKEISILQEVHSELQHEREHVKNLSQRLDATSHDIIVYLLGIMVAQSVIVLIVLLTSCCVLDRKLNSIKALLSSSSSQNTPIPVPTGNEKPKNVSVWNGNDSNLLTELTSERSKISSSSGVQVHGRSLSLTSVTDLSRQSENIAELSRPDFHSLASQRRQIWKENGELPQARSATGTRGNSPLGSFSLSSIDDRRGRVLEERQDCDVSRT